MDFNTDTGEGDQKPPDKPEPVLALERLISWCNARQNIRQLMRGVVVDLLVFGDAFIEVTWWGNVPVALYNLDTATTTPTADEHGNVTGYVQLTEFGQRAEFEPRDVIHISLDAPRSGIFGISPTQAAILPITSWLFAAACGKEMARKGLAAEHSRGLPGRDAARGNEPVESPVPGAERRPPQHRRPGHDPRRRPHRRASGRASCRTSSPTWTRSGTRSCPPTVSPQPRRASSSRGTSAAARARNRTFRTRWTCAARSAELILEAFNFCDHHPGFRG